MGEEYVSLGIGWKQCQQHIVGKEQQRVVSETIGMIVHIAAVEKESGISRLGYEIVPYGGIVRLISSYLYHLTYSKNSSYS